jgi:hypothetical protein
LPVEAAHPSHFSFAEYVTLPVRRLERVLRET